MIDLENLPHLPGCYLYLDADGKVLYVGKAKDLKKRVGNYFQKHDQTTRPSAGSRRRPSLDFIITNNEVEALLLENTLIKNTGPGTTPSSRTPPGCACIHLTDEKLPRIRISRSRLGRDIFLAPPLLR